MDWQMVGLLTLVGGCLLYVARLFVIAFGRLLPVLNRAPHAPNLNSILGEDCDDADYHLLWSTQVPVLQFLRWAGPGGGSALQVRDLYREFGGAYPELADGNTFETWLRAMEDAGLAVHCRAAATVIITKQGWQFLESLERLFFPDTFNISGMKSTTRNSAFPSAKAAMITRCKEDSYNGIHTRGAQCANLR